MIDVYAARLRSLISWKDPPRPLTKRANKERLYRMIAAVTPPLVPVSARLHRLLGRTGPRLLPIFQDDHLGAARAQPRMGGTYTFDMYFPLMTIHRRSMPSSAGIRKPGSSTS